MMDLKIYLLLTLLVVVIAKRERQLSNEDNEGEEAQTKKAQEFSQRAVTTIGENVIEKFVETLMSSERYLKMIDGVERKMNHLDTVFHEKTNNILKYLTEIHKTVKSSSSDSLLLTIKALQSDMDQVKGLVRDRLEYRPAMRAYSRGLDCSIGINPFWSQPTWCPASEGSSNSYDIKSVLHKETDHHEELPHCGMEKQNLYCEDELHCQRDQWQYREEVQAHCQH